MRFSKRYLLFLTPFILRMLVGFITLPFSTKFLNADDFGIYALVVSIALLGLTLASPSYQQIMAYHFVDASKHQQRQVISSLLFFGISAYIVFSVFLLMLWSVFSTWFTVMQEVAFVWVFVALLSVFFVFPWVIASHILTLTERAFPFALVNAAEIGSGTMVLLGALYALHLREGALFLSGLIAAVANLVGAFYVLWPYLTLSISWDWVKQVIRYTPAGFFSTLTERSKITVIGFVISTFIGTAQYGILTHSQKYEQMVMLYVSAANNTIHPISLREARAVPEYFPRTRFIWNSLYISIILIGVFFATVGQDFITVLSRGKFTAAYLFVPLWMILQLIQNAARPQTALLLSSDEGIFILKSQTFSNIVGALITAGLIPLIGLWGIVIGEFVRFVIFKSVIISRANKVYLAQVRENWVIGGSLVILATLAFTVFADPSFVGRLMCFVLVSTAVLIFAYPQYSTLKNRILYGQSVFNPS